MNLKRRSVKPPNIKFAAFLRRLIFAVLAGSLTALAADTFNPLGARIILYLRLRAPADLYQIYYDQGRGFNPADSVPLVFKGGEGHLALMLPQGELAGIRIDPGTKIASVAVLQLCLKRTGNGESLCWNGADMLQDFQARRDIADFIAGKANELQIKTYGGSPWFESVPALEPALRRFSSNDNRLPLLLALCAAVLAFQIYPLIFRGRGVLRFGTAPVFALLFVLLALISSHSARLREILPPFQGPDENDHLGKLIALERGLDCGQAGSAFRGLFSQMTPLLHHAEVKYHPPETAPSIPADAAAPNVLLGSGACIYNSFYLSPVRIFNQLARNESTISDPVQYIAKARSSVAKSALGAWLLIALLIILGRPVIPLPPALESAVRTAAALTWLHLLLLPQTLFFNAVVNQDYLLIAAGTFAAVSMFFRIAVLSDILWAAAFYAAASKAFYVVPFGLSAAVHYYGLLPKTSKFGLIKKLQWEQIRPLQLFGAALISLLCGLAALRFFGGIYCAGHWCYRLEQGAFFSDWHLFAEELLSLRRQFQTLGLPPRFYSGSAFAAFGWVDSFLPTSRASLYAAALSAAAAGAAALVLPALLISSPPERSSLARLAVISAVYFFTAYFSLYLIAVVMQGWCGEGSQFGCAYQKRYELPLYALFPLMYFSLGVYSFGRICAKPGGERQLQFFAGAVLAGLQLFSAYICAEDQLSVLRTRYYSGPAELKRYAQYLSEPAAEIEGR